MLHPRSLCLQRPTHSTVTRSPCGLAWSHLALTGSLPQGLSPAPKSVGPASRPPAHGSVHHTGVPSRFAFPVSSHGRCPLSHDFDEAPQELDSVVPVSRR